MKRRSKGNLKKNFYRYSIFNKDRKGKRFTDPFIGGYFIQLHAIVHGRVQGVFFRASTCNVANSLEITGWVRNLQDGNVEVLAQGEKSKLNALLDWLQQGPKYSHVSKVDHKFLQKNDSFSGFKVKI
ncbi:acylphosphatase [Candidatus Lokiarchaeum ossiferum]|uniref:acylphosphatase n=1 Tax=Candidatus Lokiarchaeum ossiferum TaxID=2951803 RepID=UPI00352FBB9F